jgi:superfamily II DNA or RNA helicase
MDIIVNNIWSNLKTNNKKLRKILEKKYSRKLPGVEYSNNYQRNRWDGKKRFFSKGGRFGTGLLYSILEDLAVAGLDYTLTDKRNLYHLEESDVSGLSLRDYQEDLVSMALSKRGCIVQAPTGSGKTMVLLAVLQALRGRTGVVFFTKKQLLFQTYKKLKEYGFDPGVAFGDGVELKPLMLCTAQSIHKIIDTHLETSEFIIFDEVHEFSKGKITTSMVKSFPKASIRIGMTATPPAEDYALLNIVSFLGPVVSDVDASGLIEEGFLTQPKITMLDLEDQGSADDIGLTYREIYEKYITDNEVRNDILSELVASIRKKPSKTLILVKDLKHAKTLQDMIPNSYKLEGMDSLTVREEVIQKFKEEETSVIIGTTIFQTGVDIPEITHLINARGLKSEIATLQALGRALRIHETKKEVFIYDFLDKVPYLGAHANKRIKSL